MSPKYNSAVNIGYNGHSQLLMAASVVRGLDAESLIDEEETHLTSCERAVVARRLSTTTRPDCSVREFTTLILDAPTNWMSIAFG